MGFTVFFQPVLAVESGRPLGTVQHLFVPIIGLNVDGLTPAADTSAGAGHHLHEMVFLLFFQDRFDQPPGSPG